MKNKNSRLDSIKMIISSKEVGSQEELLNELAKEGFQLTQATLSRDLKQLKVAKAASMNGNYVYVLPNNTMYKRMTDPQRASYASSLAYDIDMHNFYEIIGTIAGDDTIMLVIRENISRTDVLDALSTIIPNINHI